MPRFFMTLSHNDVSGERQEGYVLIPLAARDNDRPFWSWPAGYDVLPTGQEIHPINLDDLGVQTATRIYYVPERREFRLCADEVYRLGPDYEGCVLQVAKTGDGAYRTQVFCKGDEEYEFVTIHLTNSVPSSQKRWGYA